MGCYRKCEGATSAQSLLLMTHIFRTLEYLTKHLYRVAARYAETGMTAKNVAIVWAPNLLRCKSLEVGGVAALQGVGIQAGDQYSIIVSRQKSIFKKTQFFFKILNKVWCPIYRRTPLNHSIVKHELKRVCTWNYVNCPFKDILYYFQL